MPRCDEGRLVDVVLSGADGLGEGGRGVQRRTEGACDLLRMHNDARLVFVSIRRIGGAVGGGVVGWPRSLFALLTRPIFEPLLMPPAVQSLQLVLQRPLLQEQSAQESKLFEHCAAGRVPLKTLLHHLLLLLADDEGLYPELALQHQIGDHMACRKQSRQ